MVLEKLRLRHFRNYASLDFEPSPGRNILAGNNGQGKTNILEAVYLCGTGSSYRTRRDTELIRWGDLGFYAAGSFKRRDGALLVEVACSQDTGKTIRVNGASQESVLDHIGAANVVVFGPDDLRMIKGAPVERRRFLDTEVSSLDARYRRDLFTYRRVLAQRNALLKTARGARARDIGTALEVWDEQLVAAGARLVARRAEVVSRLSRLSEIVHRRLSSGGRLELVYRPSFAVSGAEAVGRIAEAYLRELLRRRAEEAQRCATLVGPHRDELSFTVDGVDMRVFGSQGQQRAVLLSVRLAELELIREEVGEEAILLLDDVFSELDPEKRARLLECIDARVQTLVTTTDGPSPDGAFEGARLFRISQGRLERVEEG